MGKSLRPALWLEAVSVVPQIASSIAVGLQRSKQALIVLRPKTIAAVRDERCSEWNLQAGKRLSRYREGDCKDEPTIRGKAIRG